MRKLSKLIITCGLAVALCAVYTPVNTGATFTDFFITSGFNFTGRSSANTKQDTAQQAYVKWENSSEASHNEWFRVVNSNNDARSSQTLFSYLSDGFINENNCSQGYYYYLQARREHVLNPSTTVAGTWES